MARLNLDFEVVAKALYDINGDIDEIHLFFDVDGHLHPVPEIIYSLLDDTEWYDIKEELKDEYSEIQYQARIDRYENNRG